MTKSARSGTVIFTGDKDRLATFYEAVTGMQVVANDDLTTVLTSEDFELVIHALEGEPPGRASEVRADVHVKPFFAVTSLSRTRERAASLGGRLRPADEEWEWRGFRACEAVDPDGNAIQFREEAPPRRRIFFYGLFMDRSLLEEKGLHPEIIGHAALHDFRIHIGDRATLVPSASSRAYGIVMELTDEEARALYAEPSVSEYAPESVRVELLDTGEPLEALCYNLPGEIGLAGANPEYAVRLSRLVETLGFESDYVAEVAGFSEMS